MLNLYSIYNTEGDDKDMNTIEFKGSFIRTNKFMEGGEKLFQNNSFNMVYLYSNNFFYDLNIFYSINSKTLFT